MKHKSDAAYKIREQGKDGGKLYNLYSDTQNAIDAVNAANDWNRETGVTVEILLEHDGKFIHVGTVRDGKLYHV